MAQRPSVIATKRTRRHALHKMLSVQGLNRAQRRRAIRAQGLEHMMLRPKEDH